MIRLSEQSPRAPEDIGNVMRIRKMPNAVSRLSTIVAMVAIKIRRELKYYAHLGRRLKTGVEYRAITVPLRRIAEPVMSTM